MQADTLKLLFSYIVALLVIGGGGLMLFLIRLDPPEQVGSLSLAIVGFIGAAITFVFSSESATRATRAARSVQEDTAFATTHAMTQASVNGAVTNGAVTEVDDVPAYLRRQPEGPVERS